MSELHNTIDNLSAVLDILQHTAHPDQKPVLRLMGDHLRLLARCIDDPAVNLPHIPSATSPQNACQATAELAGMSAFAGIAQGIQEIRHVRQ